MSNGQGSYYSKKTFRFLLEKRKLGKENHNGAWSVHIELTTWAPRYSKEAGRKKPIGNTFATSIASSDTPRIFIIMLKE
jgi:hypothetical protein